MGEVEQLVASQGFDCTGTCPAAELTVREEVRDMCAAGKCHRYGTSWACPPACGDIRDFERQMHSFDRCVVVQTVAQLEDEFDGETMMEAQELHARRISGLAERLDEAGLSPDVMVLSAGTCTICDTCAYPADPCRFPDKRLVSMEAAGLLVSEVCAMAGVPYNHGPMTIAFTGCVLFRQPGFARAEESGPGGRFPRPA